MNLESRKIELAKMILSIENERLLDKILNFIKGDIEIPELSKEELEIIDLSLKQAKLGQKISFDEFLKKVS